MFKAGVFVSIGEVMLQQQMSPTSQAFASKVGFLAHAKSDVVLGTVQGNFPSSWRLSKSQT